MAEQLILKGTLEGHVSLRPIHHETIIAAVAAPEHNHNRRCAWDKIGGRQR